MRPSPSTRPRAATPHPSTAEKGEPKTTRDAARSVDSAPRPDTFDASGGQDRPVLGSAAIQGRAAGLARAGLFALKEVAFEQAAEARWIGPRIDLGHGLGLGLRLRQRILRADDPAVSADPLKSTTTERLQAQGKTVFWCETGGLVELGMGLQGTIPLPAADLSVVVGFDARAIVWYRTSRPYTLEGAKLDGAREGLEVAEALLANSVTRLPLNPRTAAALEPGAEFELIGRGILNPRVGLAFNRAPGIDFTRPRLRYIGPRALHRVARVGNATLNVGPRLDATLDGVVEGEMSLKITGLDGKRLVRVTLSKKGSLAASARLSAGAGLLPLTHARQDGALSQFVFRDTFDPRARTFNETIEDFLADRFGATAYFEVGMRAEDEVLDAFVLDLDSPAAQQAFEQLLQLAPGLARALAAEENTGVAAARADALSLIRSNEISVRAFGQQLLLRQALTQNATEHYSGPDGAWAVEHRASFSKRFETLLGGKKKISWEEFTLRSSASEPLTYYHLQLEHHDKITRGAQLERLFDFAHALETRPVVEQRDPPQVPLWKRPFTFLDNSHVKVDLYFTPEAVRRIDAAGRDDGTLAFIDTLADFDPYFVEHPRLAPRGDDRVEALLERAVHIDRILGPLDACVPCATYAGEGEYFGVTGRSLRRDERALLSAERFGARVETLHLGTPSAETFFTRLGNAKGFKFYETVAALARLAGDDATLVRTLSIEGEGLRFEARNEGRIARFEPLAMARNLMPNRPTSGPTLENLVVV